jgi:hypothetical protein
MLWLRERYMNTKPDSTAGLTYKYVATPLPNIKKIYPEKKEPYLAAATNFNHTYRRADKSLIYDVNYATDGAGYRNPGTEIPTKKVPSHVLLVGCSQIFGLGINYKDTLSARLGNLLPNHAVYNLGIPGAGANDHLYLYQTFPLEKLVTQKAGVMLYVYYSDHFYRSTMAPQYLNWAEPTRPVFGLKDDRPIFLGRLQDQDEWKMFQALKKTGLERTGMELAKLADETNPDKIKLVASVIQETKNTYLKSFPKGKFYFVIFPNNNYLTESTQLIVQDLKARGMEMASYEEMSKNFHEDLKPGEVSRYFVAPEDQHPNGHANQIFSELLVEWLFKN